MPAKKRRKHPHNTLAPSYTNSWKSTIGLLSGFGVFALLLPKIMKTLIPCLSHIPTSQHAYTFQTCNTIYILDIFLTVLLGSGAMTCVMIFLLLRHQKRYIPLIVSVATIAGITIGSFYLFIPTAQYASEHAPIDLYASVEQSKEDESRQGLHTIFTSLGIFGYSD